MRSTLDRFLERHPLFRIIGADGSPYLLRYTIAKGRFGALYFHRFVRGDEDRELHSHPWCGVSLILSGGYREERRSGDRVETREFRPGSLNFLRPATFHRVDLLDPERGADTLSLAGPKVAEWGFWNRETGEETPWEEFIRRKGLRPKSES